VEWNRQEFYLQTGQLPPEMIANIRELPATSQHKALTELLEAKELGERVVLANQRLQEAQARVREINRSMPIMAEDVDTGHTLTLVPLPGQLGR
jgi:hypothetical protein